MIRSARTGDMDAVRELFREYQAWLNVDLCFQGFERELAELPGCYAQPQGDILLAEDARGFFGCVAFRPRGDTEAELKRLYVRPSERGRGVGKALFLEAMQGVEQAGYHSIVLDTLPEMAVAQAFYLDYGFQEIPAYYSNPEEGAMYFRYAFKP